MEELSKKDKRALREIIAKGMHQEFKAGMESFDAIMQQWRRNTAITGHQEHYADLYGAVMKFNKHIARRYDNLKNSNLLFVSAAQIAEGSTSEADLEGLSDDTKNDILKIAKMYLEL